MTNSNPTYSPGIHNPWKAPMYCIIFGILLRGLGFEVFWLYYSMPILGGMLLFWGSHTLRNRHPAFETASKMALGLLAIDVLGFIFSFIAVIAILPALIINILLLLQLRKGVKAEYARSGMEQKPDVFLWYILYPFLAIALALFSIVLFPLVILICIGIICLLVWIIYHMFHMVTTLGEISPDLEKTLAETQNPSVQMQVATSVAFALIYLALCILISYL